MIKIFNVRWNVSVVKWSLGIFLFFGHQLISWNDIHKLVRRTFICLHTIKAIDFFFLLYIITLIWVYNAVLLRYMKCPNNFWQLNQFEILRKRRNQWREFNAEAVLSISVYSKWLRTSFSKSFIFLCYKIITCRFLID